MMSMMSGFPFTPIISFIFSFFILSIFYFLADLLITSISVDKILFISLVGIYHTSAHLHYYLLNSEVINFVIVEVHDPVGRACYPSMGQLRVATLAL
jgi:hypothetical protein